MGEPQKTSTWVNNPKIFLNVRERCVGNLEIKLARSEKGWAKQIGKNPVGCMLGLYVLPLVRDDRGRIEITKEMVLHETTFKSGCESILVIEGGLEVGTYVLLCCNYEPGKEGGFVVYAYGEGGVCELMD